MTETLQNQEIPLPKTDGLTWKQRASLKDFTTAPTLTEACSRVGISRQTAYIWLKSEAFQRALEEARNNISREVFDTFKRNSLMAAETIVELAKSKNEWVRLQASQSILAYLGKAKESEELETRLSTIERVIFERRSFSQ
jgi:hypothetical protein